MRSHKKYGAIILIRCSDWIDSVAYGDVLAKGLLPMYAAQNIFQHNGVLWHKSRFVSSFLTSPKCVYSVIDLKPIGRAILRSFGGLQRTI